MNKIALFWFALAAFLGAATHGASLSPAQRLIAEAERAIAQGSADAETHNRLALAFSRRARETADPQFYERASRALQQSLRLAPDNFEARKTHVWILLGQHEFAQALAAATALNRRSPDDLMVYTMLVDAHVELGHYAEAEVAAQWLLDLRPGNVAGLTRAAYLRELFGDLDGAIELMTQACERTPPAEVEDRAWLLTQLAHLQRMNGRHSIAEALADAALTCFPNYHYALAELAKVRLDQKRPHDAVTLLRARYEAAPHPENLFALGEALSLAGRRKEAREAFRDFEIAARAESGRADNANRELIHFYLDHARKPKEAPRIAEAEMKRRADIHTRDAYAAALFANGRRADARREWSNVLAIGTRDPSILAHARRAGITPSVDR